MMPPWGMGMGMPQMGGGSAYGGYGGGMDPQMVSLLFSRFFLRLSIFVSNPSTHLSLSLLSQAAMMAAQAAYQRPSFELDFSLVASSFSR